MSFVTFLMATIATYLNWLSCIILNFEVITSAKSDIFEILHSWVSISIVGVTFVALFLIISMYFYYYLTENNPHRILEVIPEFDMDQNFELDDIDVFHKNRTTETLVKQKIKILKERIKAPVISPSSRSFSGKSDGEKSPTETVKNIGVSENSSSDGAKNGSNSNGEKRKIKSPNGNEILIDANDPFVSFDNETKQAVASPIPSIPSLDDLTLKKKKESEEIPLLSTLNSSREAIERDRKEYEKLARKQRWKNLFTIFGYFTFIYIFITTMGFFVLNLPFFGLSFFGAETMYVYAQVIGYISTGMIFITYIPQILLTFFYERAGSLSLITLCIVDLGSFLNMCFFIAANQYFATWSNSLAGFIQMSTILLELLYFKIKRYVRDQVRKVKKKKLQKKGEEERENVVKY